MASFIPATLPGDAMLAVCVQVVVVWQHARHPTATEVQSSAASELWTSTDKHAPGACQALTSQPTCYTASSEVQHATRDRN